MPAPQGGSPIEPDIKELAAPLGILVDWVDAWGDPQTVATDDLLRVIEAVTGRTLTTRRDRETLAGDLAAAVAEPAPVIVAWDGVLPARPEPGVVVTEAGDQTTLVAGSGGWATARPLPLGYHQLHGDPAATPTLIISAPTRAHPPPQRAFGVLAPVYALRSGSEDSGIGDLADLARLASQVAGSGVDVIATLPLLATFEDQPSPYAPASRRAWNDLFIDLAAAPGWSGELPISRADPRWVDYDGDATAVREALAGYAAAVASRPGLRAEIDAFLAAHPDVARYARFRATCDRHGKDWRSWPRRPEPDPDRIHYHETTQWLADRQLRSVAAEMEGRHQLLYTDLPIGCHPDGYDIWDRPDVYAPASIGAPPDTLFGGGQDWGLPAPIPDRSRRDGHTNFIQAVRHQLQVAGLLRIDHVMGLYRAWWVPHGAAPTAGAYVMQPAEELFAIVCLESVRAGSGIVGENLGTVPPEVGVALDEHGLHGMVVAQDGLDVPRPVDAIALSTHDTPPFAAWWVGSDINDAEDLGIFDASRAASARRDRADTIAYLEELFSTRGLAATRNRIVEWMAASPASVAIVNLDDLWGERRRQNVPGTDTERPNWRARHARSLDELAADRRLRSDLARYSDIRHGSLPS
jgi:4-alpha-glucanotransferase